MGEILTRKFKDSQSYLQIVTSKVIILQKFFIVEAIGGFMNAINFLSLLNMIYGNKKLDIKKVQEMGLLAVKIGQVHALRLDFLDRKKCEQLATLYRHNVVIPQEEVLKDIEKINFKYVDDKPLAAASIGQVYRGQLKNGKDVVIKIVKKNFREDFNRDVAAVKKLFKIYIFLYSKIKKVFNPMGILNHIEEYTLRELDLNNEVLGQETLKKIYNENKTNPNLKLLRFPKIYKEISNDRIMVSEYVAGKTFDELLEQKELSYETLLEFFRIQGFYIFNIGTFHGDIHPGNMILKEGKIYFVDTGAIGHATLRIRKGLFRFFEALTEYDYKESSNAIHSMSEVEINNNKFVKFQNAFYDLYKNFKDKTVSEVSLTRKMMETIKLAVNHGMIFEDGMFPIIKSLMFLDGMVIRCNPSAVLIQDMKPYIANFSKGASK